MNGLQKLLYRLSGYKDAKKPLDVPTALQAMLEHGISIGKHNATPVVVEKRVCRKHEMVLLVEVEIGRYNCPICEEERHTGPIQQPRMMNMYNDARRAGASPNTAIQKTVRLTQDLSKLKGVHNDLR